LSGDVKITLLAGDASTRRYYRVFSGGSTRILMQDEPFSKDASAIKCNRYFKELGIRVPELYEINCAKGTIIQEDVGSVHLESISDDDEVNRYYDEALDIMVRYQKGAKGFDVSFTKEKFMSELIMANDYYSHSKDKNVHVFFNELVDEMMAQKSMFLHRDYHSRNLMVSDGHLVVIDYQDARTGPFTYDLASLLIDPYRSIDPEKICRLIKSYHDKMKDVVDITYQEYERAYRLCYLQRGIKILGTYAYQKVKKNNDNYTKYIEPSVKKVRAVVEAFPEWKDIILGAVIR